MIRGGLRGRERLRVLSRLMWPTTASLLERVGVDPAARCIDVGCGGGDVTVALARLARTGRAVGIDADEAQLEMARREAVEAGVRNIEFRVVDITDPPATDETFDLVFARFLLSHLRDPVPAVLTMRSLLAPGGMLVVEDVDFRGHFCHPDSSAFRRYVELYTELAHRRGCDPNIGPRVPWLLLGAGLEGVGMHVVQPAGFTGEVKVIGPLTLELIRDPVEQSGLATHDELDRVIDELYAFAADPETVTSTPRIVQSWGRQPA